eukprot:TRINITY_DN63251_c0_g1_i1.p1 TRINITY_DN63251_c0_g1~~TRINITY_DN63251_c0_g1_i1.p1  ORF type:complete len:493 (-),score=56.25 TRINITY_DN63251_c0_g1_i1:567-2045(-)
MVYTVQCPNSSPRCLCNVSHICMYRYTCLTSGSCSCSRSRSCYRSSTKMYPKRIPTLSVLICFTVFLVSISLNSPIFTLIRSNRSSPSWNNAIRSPKLPFETFSISKASSKHPQRAQFAEQLKAFLHIIVTQYTNWHRQQRRLCDVNPAHARSLPLLVFRSNGNAGVGDRIRGILYTYLVAVASDRLFLIDWHKPLPVANVLRSPPTFNFTYDTALFTANADEEHAIWGPDDYHNLDVYFSSKRVVINQSPNNFTVKHFLSIFERYPQLNLSRRLVNAGLQHFHAQREHVAPFILNALFQTSPSLRNSVRKLMPFHAQPYISLHARLGHGVGETSGRFDFKQQGMSLESVSHCMGTLAATMAQQRGLQRVFIVTDTYSARQFLEAGIRAVLPDAHVQMSPINATHFFAMHKNEYILDERERRNKFEEVFVDLALLSMAQSMVFFRSGYGAAAAWLGAITDSVMVEYDNCTLIQERRMDVSELLSQRLFCEIA